MQAKHHIQTPPWSFKIKQLSNYLFRPGDEWALRLLDLNTRNGESCVLMLFARIYSLSHWIGRPTDHHAYRPDPVCSSAQAGRPIISGHFGTPNQTIGRRLRLMGQTLRAVCLCLVMEYANV